MKTELECIPCILRQTVDTAKLSTNDPSKQEAAVRAVLDSLKDFNLEVSPPISGRDIYRLIGEITGNPDPYKKIKHNYNIKALELYPAISDLIARDKNPLLLAAKIAAAGNIIDFGATSKSYNIENFVSEIETLEFKIDQSENFIKDMGQIQSLLYLADNAGEIVFDRIFIETIKKSTLNPGLNITVAVRGKPVINDATLKDAKTVGLTEIVKVISNGDNVPGTDLKNTSSEFQEAFSKADLIVSKGMGNFETLESSTKLIYHLLKAKCHFTARILDVELGSIVFYRQSRTGDEINPGIF